MPWVSYINSWIKEYECTSLLDLGCGEGNITHRIVCDSITGLEIYDPYIEKARERGITVIKANVPLFLPKLENNSFDLVMGTDFLEHLAKPTALEVIDEAERIARKIVVWGMPLERILPIAPDPFDMPTQHHRSLWKEEEFEERGYSKKIFKNFHTARDMIHYIRPANAVPFDAGIFWKVL